MKNFPHLYFYYALLAFTLSSTCSSLANAAPTKNVALNKEVVSIQNAWVRPTNAGQEVGAAYMTLSSAQNVTLVHIESDVTNSVEIHSMSMENGIMKMRMLNTLLLPAGKTYQLAPGGFHLMLFDLKKPLKLGDHVSFVLHFQKTNNLNKKPVVFKQNIRAMVQSPLEDQTPTQHLH